MDVVWIAIGLVFAALVVAALVDAITSEPGLEPVHVAREGRQLLVAVVALALYVVIVGESLAVAVARTFASISTRAVC